jgi:WD40 repeat protein
MNDITFSSGLNMGTHGSSSGGLLGTACVGHRDGSVTYWDMNTRSCLTHQQAHQGETRGVTFSVDGSYLASASFDSSVKITDARDLDNLTTVKTLYHEDRVVSVKWHPFLPLLLSTSADKTARIWYPQMGDGGQ